MATIASTPAQIETLPKRPNALWAFTKTQPLGLVGFLIILVYVVCAFVTWFVFLRLHTQRAHTGEHIGRTPVAVPAG